MTLDDINQKLRARAAELGIDLTARQSNHEGVLVDWIHDTRQDSTDGIVINPGAYTHTSIAIRDAIAGVNKPVVECHLSNVHAREDFRHHSYLTPVCVGIISGFGWHSYMLALDAIVQYIEQRA
jgi:3-dehydroquinate dehydratase-2